MATKAREACALCAVAVAASLQSFPAFAGGIAPRPVSEPETLALLAIGAVAVIVARWKKRK